MTIKHTDPCEPHFNVQVWAEERREHRRKAIVRGLLEPDLEEVGELPVRDQVIACLSGNGVDESTISEVDAILATYLVKVSGHLYRAEAALTRDQPKEKVRK